MVHTVELFGRKVQSTSPRFLTWAGLLLALYFITQFGDIWRIPFINEDYSFLDMTRDRNVLSLWREPGLYVGPWFRPWAQGIHYALLQGAFGTRVELWHIAHACLWLTILVAYFALAMRLAGRAVAAIATACLATSTAWGLIVAWIAGVQDLWMLLFALVTLHAVDRHRMGLGAFALLLALASKETAAVLPALGTAWGVLRHQQPWKLALRKAWPLWAMLVGWFLVHPTLGARRWWHDGSPHAQVEAKPATNAGPAPAFDAWKLPLQPLNLDVLPRPERGWGSPLARALLGALPLAALVLLPGERRRSSSGFDPGGSRVVGIGLAWAVLGWLPLLMPGLGWHGYYALFGTMGVWVALAPLLGRWKVASIAMLVALLILRAGRAVTPSHDWGEESYVRRAGEFLSFMRIDLQKKVPEPAPHSRFFFDAVPSEVGFLVGDGPSLRLWYGDSTLSGGFYGDYRARPARSAGNDYFFRYDTTRGWVSVRLGREDVAEARRIDPQWANDHELVAISLALGGDWTGATHEYAKLARAYPDTSLYSYFAGSSALSAGDTVTGRYWLARATRLPDATERMREAARAVGIDPSRPSQAP